MLCNAPTETVRGEAVLAEYHRAWELTEQLRLDEAIPALERLIARNPRFHLAYKTLAAAYEFGRKWQPGLSHFHRLLERDPTNVLPHYGAGLLVREYAPDTAREEFRQCIAKSGTDSISHLCYQQLAHLGETIHPTSGSAMSQVSVGLAINAAERADYRSAHAIGLRELQKAVAQSDLLLEAAYLAVLIHASQDCAAQMLWTQRLVKLAQQTGDRDLELESAGRMAECLQRTGHVNEALAVLLKYESISSRWGSWHCHGSLLRRLADVYENRGDLSKALESNLRARDILQHHPGSTYYETFHHAGDIYRKLGRIPEATIQYGEMLRAAERNGSETFQAYGWRYLGDLSFERGSFFDSLMQHSRSFLLFDRLARNSRFFRNTSGASLTRIGRIYTLLGDDAAAERYFNRALGIAMQTGDRDPQARVHVELGNLDVRKNRLAAGVSHFETALTLDRHIGSEVFTRPALLGLCRAYRQLDRLPEALSRVEEALRSAELHGVKSDQAEARIELGATYLRHGKPAEAEKQISIGLDMGTSMDSMRLILPARIALADVEETRGRTEESLRHLTLAIQVVESLRNRIPGANFRSGLRGQFSQIYERAGDLLARKGRIRDALVVAEQNRARGVLDLLAEGTTFGRKPAPSYRDRHSALTSALSQASTALLNKDSAENRQAVVQAEQSLQQWIAESYQSSPSYLKIRYPGPISIEQAQFAVPDQETAFVEYALSDEASRVWVVRRTGVNFAALAPRSKIEGSVTAYRRLVGMNPRSGADFDGHVEASRELYKALISPIESHLAGVRRLLIIADGALHYLPFETLQHNQRYLIEDYTVAYAPSISVFGTLMRGERHRSHITGLQELVAFGDPTYGQGVDGPRGPLMRSGMHLGRLPYTRSEVLSIAGLYGKSEHRTYLGESATEHAVKTEGLERFRRIHFAAHAVIDEHLPARSGILLAPGSPNEDGLLTMAELADLNLNADIVVLSACQTGLGQLVRGEGLVGLTRAIFCAGSPRVAVSLWEVNDLTTAKFMATFYRHMRSQPPSIALRNAKLDWIRGSAQGLRHPYFWAPFVLAGLF